MGSLFIVLVEYWWCDFGVCVKGRVLFGMVLGFWFYGFLGFSVMGRANVCYEDLGSGLVWILYF